MTQTTLSDDALHVVAIVGDAPTVPGQRVTVPLTAPRSMARYDSIW